MRFSDEFLVSQAKVIAVVRVAGCGAPRLGGQGQSIIVAAIGGKADGWEYEVHGGNVHFYLGEQALVVLAETVTWADGTTLTSLVTKYSSDDQGMLTDDVFPDRRWPLEVRLRQLEAAMANRPSASPPAPTPTPGGHRVAHHVAVNIGPVSVGARETLIRGVATTVRVRVDEARLFVGEPVWNRTRSAVVYVVATWGMLNTYSRSRRREKA